MVALILAVVASIIPDDLFGGADETAETEPVPAVVDDTQVVEIEPESAETDQSTESGSMAEPGTEDDGADNGAAVASGSESVEVVEEPTPIPTETPVPTPELKTLYVNSPIVGLYIRDLPEGDIIDVLDDQTELGLLAEGDEINGIRWIQVQTNDGREGWVAEQFTTDVPPLAPISDETDG